MLQAESQVQPDHMRVKTTGCDRLNDYKPFEKMTGGKSYERGDVRQQQNSGEVMNKVSWL